MINRENWEAVKSYLQYREEVEELSSETILLEKTWLRHFLEWSQETSFVEAKDIRPTYRAHLAKLKSTHDDKLLSNEYKRKLLSSARRFLIWLRKHDCAYQDIPITWLDTLTPSRFVNPRTTHEFVTFDEMKAMATAPTFSLVHKRIQAASAFLFLSGIRVGAFATLPLKAVNIEDRTIFQFPSLGVKTKFQKEAETFLLNIPELLDIVQNWDELVREALPIHGYWFAPLCPETGAINVEITEVGTHRDSRLRKDLQEWLERVGLPYHSPHKFRHGHAVYAIKLAKDVATLKAISQNLMHSNLSVTDGVYGILSANDTRELITCLGASS